MALTKVTSGMVNPDPSDAANLSSGSVPAARLGNVDTSGIISNADDIALLGFKVAANGSLAKYNLVDQAIDDFQDASGIDASASTNEIRDGTGNFYSGAVAITGATAVFTSTGSATWTAPDPAPPNGVEVLVVGGGGGGGRGYLGGGGGGSGIVHDTDYAVVAGTGYDLSVGAGGAGSTDDSVNGANGTDSIWNINAEGSGIAFTAKGGGGGASVSVSSNPPGSPSGGDLWWDSDVGELYIYYSDTDSNQWVETSGGSETVTYQIMHHQVQMQEIYGGKVILVS